MALQREEYLGDGVYIGFDGYQIWLSTQQGDRIALEPSVYRNLKDYAQRLEKARESGEIQKHYDTKP